MVSEIMGLEGEYKIVKLLLPVIFCQSQIITCYIEPNLFITGSVVIVDFEGYTLSHVTHRPLAFMKKQSKFFQVSEN